MAIDYIRYDLLVQDALRSVVRKVLTDAARTGLPGEHHFNISFKTQAPGVVIPAAMRQRYPEEMAIILQHEFWDLTVGADAFEVSLNFSRKPERLTIPFDTITGFSDPSVPFGFKLEARDNSEAKPTLSPTFAAPNPSHAVPKSTVPAAKPQSAIPATPAPRAALSAKPSSKPGPAPTGPRAVEPPKAPEKSSEKAREGEPAKVVSIDAFRKK